MAQHDQSRNILERIHISGKLILQSPAHFGNGDIRSNTLVDMSLLLDDAEESRSALIPGTTIAGALRSYLGERLRGYNQAEIEKSVVSDLFGPIRSSEDETADQSLLVVDDAFCASYGKTLRDGVRIDAKSGTAYQDETGGAKFDVELLEAGATFELHFELLLTAKNHAAKLIPYVLAALGGLEQGEIRLGLRKRRGYGRCQVTEWKVNRYQMKQPTDLCAWLETPAFAHRSAVEAGTLQTAFANAFANEPALAADTTDTRNQFSIIATFGLEKSSLLIRSGFGEADMGADFVHLHAYDEKRQFLPTIPGTSWAGVIRHRALRIANTVATQAGSESTVKRLLEDLFGRVPTSAEADVARRMGKTITGTASRATLDETYVSAGQQLQQTRVRIDRFTGGAFESALFTESPIYGTDKTQLGFQLHLRNPEKHEIGLLLLVLKDLWTGDLPIGGEAAVGRGRLTGKNVTVNLPKQNDKPVQMQLRREQPSLALDDKQRMALQEYVDALWVKLGGESNNGQ